MAKNYLYRNEKMEKLPGSELTKLHEEKIKKTINHMWNNNQYLQNKIKKAGRSPNDLEGVGDITKLLLMHQIKSDLS